MRYENSNNQCTSLESLRGAPGHAANPGPVGVGRSEAASNNVLPSGRPPDDPATAIMFGKVHDARRILMADYFPLITRAVTSPENMAVLRRAVGRPTRCARS